MDKDIFEYDKLNIYAKKNKSSEFIERYKCFNWTLETESENKKYEDLQDLTFSRPHKIKHKDDLQLLQVYMEENLNLIGKLEKYKYARTQSFVLCLGGIVFTLIALAIWFFISKIEIHSYFVSAIVMLSISAMLIVLICIFTPKILKRDKQNYIKHNTRLENEVNDICQKAKSLIGGDHEN